jgi:hypothetical protein
MGCSISCSLFEKLSTFLEHHIKLVTGSQNIKHYLDGYILALPSYDSCKNVMIKFEKACEELGVPIAQEKTEGPSQVLTYLGLEINTTLRQVRVPSGTILATRGAIERALGANKLTLQQVQSLIGSLGFLCKAIRPGRAFLRRLINLTRGVSKSYYKVRITRGAKDDLAMWHTFLMEYNGVTFFQDRHWVNNESVQLFTDSAGSIGFGMYYKGKWSQGRWPSWVKQLDLSIAAMELFPIYVAILMWDKDLSNMKICFMSDTMTTVSSIIIMKVIREIVVLLAVEHFVQGKLHRRA